MVPDKERKLWDSDYICYLNICMLLQCIQLNLKNASLTKIYVICIVRESEMPLPVSIYKIVIHFYLGF